MNIKELSHWMVMRIQRSNYDIHGRIAKKKSVNIEYCDLENIGDALAPIVVKYMLDRKNIDPDKPINKTKHLVTIGSIIGWGLYDHTVWGSGILREFYIQNMRKRKRIYKIKYDIRAVRGPITRMILLALGEECPAIYGDPAILMPEIYVPDRTSVKYETSLILHHRTKINNTEATDENKYQINLDEFEKLTGNHLNIISPKTNDYKLFIDEIVSSKLIISSSLHGIILAESYGIPSIFLNWGVADQQIKFLDWYLSTNRMPYAARSLDEAVKMQHPKVPDLSYMKQQLISAFPYDLWQ